MNPELQTPGMPRRRSLVAVFLAVGLSVAVLAAGAWRASVISGIRDPMLFCPRVIDFGPQEIGAEATKTFAIENRGGSNLIVRKCQSSCGCSQLEQHVDGKCQRIDGLTLQPGECRQVSVRMAVQGLPGGTMTGQIAIYSNDPSEPVAAINLIVPRLLGGVRTLPTSVVFGTLRRHRPEARAMGVYAGLNTERTIEQVTSASATDFEARFVPNGNEFLADELLGPRLGTVYVTATAARVGTLVSEIRIQLKGETRRPDSIPVVARVESEVEVTPSRVALDESAANGAAMESRLVCRANNDVPYDFIPHSVPEPLIVNMEPIAGTMSQVFVNVACPPRIGDRAQSMPNRILQIRAVSPMRSVVMDVPVICR